jgi:Uma2 family endonuclease
VLPDVEVLVKAGELPTVRAPDIIITREDRAAANPSRLDAADVLVAVEIISPGTGTTDHVTTMYEYADAGIPHYWLVDLDKPVTFTAYTVGRRGLRARRSRYRRHRDRPQTSLHRPHPGRFDHPGSSD